MFEITDLILLGLCPILLMPAWMCFTRGAKRRPLVWRGPKPAQPLLIPSAEETAEAVRRFREATNRLIYY